MPRTVKKAAASLSSNPVSTTPPESTNKMLPVVVVLSTLLLVALCATGYFYYQYRQSPQVADAKEIEELVETIGAFFTLPEGETPTLATVTDREKLAEQPFFQKAENGDKVLIYSQSGRAILYRPGNGKIVDVTTVNVNNPTAAATETPTPQVLGETTPQATPVTVTLYNGSRKVGLTNTLEAKITAGVTGAIISQKEPAARNDYETATVVDVSGKNAAMAETIATLLGGSVGSLPEGETAPNTDILVIAGNATE